MKPFEQFKQTDKRKVFIVSFYINRYTNEVSKSYLRFSIDNSEPLLFPILSENKASEFINNYAFEFKQILTFGVCFEQEMSIRHIDQAIELFFEKEPL